MCLVATVFNSTALDINQNLYKWSRKEIFHGYILINTDNYFEYEVRQRPTNSAFLCPVCMERLCPNVKLTPSSSWNDYFQGEAPRKSLEKSNAHINDYKSW